MTLCTRRPCWFLFFAALGLSPTIAPGAEPGRAPLAPVVARADLDPRTFREWAEGAERPVTDSDAGPSAVVWTSDAKPSRGEPRYKGITFGAGKTPGPRHLRIGFTRPQIIGTVILGGAGRVSALKPGAVYPGDLADESQWIP